MLDQLDPLVRQEAQVLLKEVHRARWVLLDQLDPLDHKGKQVLQGK